MATPNFGQFRVTRLWHQIIEHLSQNASISRRRYLLRQYDNVFTGANATDVVFQCLDQNSEQFPTEVTRQSAVKVCQSLMDNFIFEPANKGQQGNRFEDNQHRYYKFTNHNEISSTKENKGMYPETQTFTEFKVCPNPNFASRTPSPLLSKKCPTRRSLGPRSDNPLSSPMKQFSQPNTSFSRRTGLRRRHSFVSALRDCNIVEDLSKLNTVGIDIRCANKQRKGLRMSMARARQSQETKELTSSKPNSLAVDKERSLSYLLTLVNISFLESILNTAEYLPESRPTSTSVMASGQKSNQAISTAFSNVTSDLARIPWVVSTIVCLGYLPDGLESLWSAQACKLKCYQVAVEHHSCLPSTILPEDTFQICLAIVALLQKKEFEVALKVARLLLDIIPPQRKAQLQKLLHLLGIVSEDIFVRVDKEFSNLDAVKRDFSSAILKHSLLSIEHRAAFMDFLLRRYSILFTSFSQELQDLGELTFCRRIRITEADQRLITIRSLIHLAEVVNKSDKMTQREKKIWTKKLLKSHPELIV